MRGKTGGDHGVVRHVDPNGSVIEATFKEGRIHGFYRMVSDDEVYVSLEMDGNTIAYILFDQELNEVNKDDKEGLLSQFSLDGLKK